GIGEHDFRADFAARANGLREWIGRLDRHVDRLIFFVFVGIEDHRDLRQAGNGSQVSTLKGDRQFKRDYLRPLPQERLPYLMREFEPARNNRKICEAPAPQASGIRQKVFAGHTAMLLLPGSARWRFRAPRFRGSSPSRGSSASKRSARC